MEASNIWRAAVNTTTLLRIGISPSVESEEVLPGVVLDYDKDSQMVGIEITDGSKFADLSRLAVHGLDTAVVHNLQ